MSAPAPPGRGVVAPASSSRRQCAASRWKELALSWVGAAVSALALISYFTVSVRVPSLRDSAWLNLLGVALGLGLAVAAFVRRRSVSSAAGLALSAVVFVALVGFVTVVSRELPPEAEAIGIGELAPAFELEDQNGHPVALSDFTGSHLVLVFYRGFW